MRCALLFALVGAATAQVSTSDIQRLLSGLSQLQQATEQLTSAVSQVSNPGQAAGILTLVDKIKSGLAYATSQVNEATGTPSDAQQAQIFQATEAIYPSIIQSLDATVGKAALFKQYGFSTVVASQLQGIQSSVDDFSKALIAKTTSPYTAPAEEFESIVDDAFSSALATQSPSSMALPSIPSATSAAVTSGAATSAAVTSAAVTSAATAGPSAGTSVAMTTGSPVAPIYTGGTSAMATSAASPTGASPSSYTGAAEKMLANVALAAAAAAAALAM